MGKIIIGLVGRLVLDLLQKQKVIMMYQDLILGATRKGLGWYSEHNSNNISTFHAGILPVCLLEWCFSSIKKI